MSAIGPGDFVECINPSGRIPSVLRSDDPTLGLVRGVVYCVARTLIHPFGSPAVLLVGQREYGELLPCGKRHYGWSVQRFRPFHGPELEHLNHKADEPVKETA